MKIYCKNRKARKFAKWIARYFKLKDVFVHLEIHKGMSPNEHHSWMEGITDTVYKIEIYKKDAKANDYSVERAIAHEMAHVMQHATDQMVEAKYRGAYWHGKWINEETTPYIDLPWEIDARQWEQKLMMAYADYKYG